MKDAVALHSENLDSRKIPDKEMCVDWAAGIKDAVYEQAAVSENLMARLETLFVASETDGYDAILERTGKAVEWFTNKINEELYSKTKAHIEQMKVKKQVKKYIKDLNVLLQVFAKKKCNLSKQESWQKDYTSRHR
jgi:hypothetical protein